jgi:hypothetical protein
MKFTTFVPCHRHVGHVHADLDLVRQQRNRPGQNRFRQESVNPVPSLDPGLILIPFLNHSILYKIMFVRTGTETYKLIADLQIYL